MDSATWCPTPAAASAARRLRPVNMRIVLVVVGDEERLGVVHAERREGAARRLASWATGRWRRKANERSRPRRSFASPSFVLFLCRDEDRLGMSEHHLVPLLDVLEVLHLVTDIDRLHV